MHISLAFLITNQGPLDIPNGLMDSFYAAYAEFERVAWDPSLLLSIVIQPVGVILFFLMRVNPNR